MSENPPTQLKEKAKTGLIWLTVSSFGTQIIGFGTSIILARLLRPDEIGLYGLTGIVIALANIFSEMGFGIPIK